MNVSCQQFKLIVVLPNEISRYISESFPPTHLVTTCTGVTKGPTACFEQRDISKILTCCKYLNFETHNGKNTSTLSRILVFPVSTCPSTQTTGALRRSGSVFFKFSALRFYKQTSFRKRGEGSLLPPRFLRLTSILLLARS